MIMRLIIYLKTTFKLIISKSLIMAASFVALPILLAFFMGFAQNGDSENPIKYSRATVSVVNEDKSEEATKLIRFLKSKEMKELIKVVDKEDSSDGSIIIPKGYGESLKNKESNKIVIENDSGVRALDIVKVVLDNYHGNKSLEETVIKNVVTKEKENNSYEIMAISMLGFVISMLLYSSVVGVYTDICRNMDRRIISMPMTKSSVFVYDFICNILNAVIILLIYLLFFRILGIAFMGSIVTLLIILLVTAYTVVSISTFVSKVFSEKIGKIIGFMLFIIPVLGGEMFTGTGNNINKFAVTHYIIKIFSDYTSTRSLLNEGSTIFYLVIVSTVLFITSLVVINLKKEVKY